MPHTPSAFKRIRQGTKRRLYNRSHKSAIHTAIRQLEVLAKAKDAAKLPAALKHAIRSIDKAAARGVLHKNTAARRKSSLTRLAAAAAKTA